jgi:hypothetical protein
MMRLGHRTFEQVWGIDFEFGAVPGERPQPICLVAHEMVSGQVVRLWEDDLQRRTTPPYPTDAGSVVIAYYASAEIGCHLALGWPVPVNILDLYVEFRNHCNGTPPVAGNGLLGALVHFGLDPIDGTEKDQMRELALRGGPWTPEERRVLLDYCESDVVALTKLLPRMNPYLDIDRALLRGRYMAAVARIEARGIPVDGPALSMLRGNWEYIQDRLIERIDHDYGVFEGRTFKRDRWAQWLAVQNIPWPRLPSGQLALDDDTFEEIGRRYPRVQPIRQLRQMLSQLRLHELPVGHDGRNRCLLSAFGTKTGRNAPSTSRFMFGTASWLRGLIKPSTGSALAYLDWQQQEFGIAAALSGDPAMLDAYTSGDPYLAFAKQAGAVPPDATKESHGTERNLFKTCTLAVQYGMGAQALARQIGGSIWRAKELLRLHRETYPVFWRWSAGAVDVAFLHRLLRTVFGWQLRTGPDVKVRTIQNFPVQANGAEMLRLACCLATEDGVGVCAPIHDALLIEAPVDEFDYSVDRAQRAMSDASAIVLDGLRLRTDIKIIRYPDRFVEERGSAMWAAVWDILKELGVGGS